MDWVYLLLAGLFEVIWAVGLKYSANFTKFFPSIITAIAAATSFLLLSLSLKTIPLGTAYAIWTGIGIVGTVIFGAIWFGEPMSVMKIISFLLILTGTVGLKILS